MRPILGTLFCFILIKAFAQPDSLRYQRNEGLPGAGPSFCIDSLKHNADTLRLIFKNRVGVELHTLVKRGAPIGLLKSYYDDGSKYEEAMFDSIPKLWIRDLGVDGHMGFYDSLYRTTPIYYRNYYRNHRLWTEMECKPTPKYEEHGLPHYLIKCQTIYYRNGHVESYEFNSDTLVQKLRYDWKLRLDWEEIKTKDYDISIRYYYSDNIYSHNGVVHKNKILKKVVKLSDNPGPGGGYPNWTTYIYNLPDNKLIKTEIYKNKKLVN